MPPNILGKTKLQGFLQKRKDKKRPNPSSINKLKRQLSSW
jgi:hypothetical protein